MILLSKSRALQNLFDERREREFSMSKQEIQVSSNVNPTEIEYDWSEYTILIAEDEETNYVYLETALQKTDVKVLRAKNGREAVELAKITPHIDLVLMDIKMPEMNGLEATRSIKSFRKDLIIIAQTAFAMEEDRRNCTAVGCDDFLPKPIRYKVLLETIAKYLK
jgi:two-component system, cell cycle response regulator DivK